METTRGLAGFQRAALLRQAHHLTAVATVGKQGITDQVVRHVEQELLNHELIKVRFVDFKEERKPIAEALAERTQAVLVRVIGHVAILYRRAQEPDDRRIHLPERP